MWIPRISICGTISRVHDGNDSRIERIEYVEDPVFCLNQCNHTHNIFINKVPVSVNLNSVLLILSRLKCSRATSRINIYDGINVRKHRR